MKDGKIYKLNIPANVPAKDFWSVVVYDPQTRSQLQTGQPFPAKNNKRDKLDINKDGSVDLYFGAKASEGKEANWIETVSGKGWFACLRIYVPLFFAGNNVPAQQIARPVTPYDIAATIAVRLEIKPPSGSVGTPLVEVLGQ